MQSLPDFDLVLFGGTGDLAMRKLLPALYRRLAAGQVTQGSRIVGAARSGLSQEEYLSQVEESCRKHVGSDFDPAQWERFARILSYVKIDVGSQDDFAALKDLLGGREELVRVF